MPFRLKFALTSLFLGIALNACGEDSAAVQSEPQTPNPRTNSGSFLADYLARQNGATAAPSVDLTGQWSGLLYCGGRDFPVRIDLASSKTGTVSFDPMIGKARNTSPFSKPYNNAPVDLSVGSDTRTFTLLSAPQPGVDPKNAVGLSINGVLEPETQNMALIQPYEMRGKRAARSCEFGVIARGEAAAQLQQMETVLAGLYGSLAPVISQACPPGYSAWLNEAMALGDAAKQPGGMNDLLYGAVFEQTFGARYADIAAKDLIKIGQIMSGSCLRYEKNPQGRANWIRARALVSNINNHRYYQSNRHNALKSTIAANWLDWMLSEIKRQAPISRFNLSGAAATPRRFQFKTLGIDTGNALPQSARAYSDKLAASARDAKFAQQLEAQKDNFKGLLAQRQFALQRDDYSVALAQEALDYYLAPAAKTLAAGADLLVDAVYMASWSAANADGAACPAASQSACDSAADTFAQAAQKAAMAFAATSETETAGLYQKNSGLGALSASVAQEVNLQRRHGALFEYDAFANLRADLQDRRRAIQKTLRTALIERAESLNTAPQLTAIKTQYFLGSDLEHSAMQAVAETIDERLQGTAPFTGVFGADYLNALYNQDFTELRRLDAYYMETIRPLMDFGTQQAVTLGPLLDALSGAAKGTARRDIQRGVANLSALYAVMGTYLVNYQDAYGACLKPNAVSFEITQRTDRVTTDAFGREIARTRGWTQSDTYRINREFESNFNELFGTATSKGGEQLFDLFLNDGRVTRLRSGVKSMMRNTPCSSSTVAQLERGMLAYDTDVSRRMRGR